MDEDRFSKRIKRHWADFIRLGQAILLQAQRVGTKKSLITGDKTNEEKQSYGTARGNPKYCQLDHYSVQDSSLLRCYAVSTGKQSTFRRT